MSTAFQKIGTDRQLQDHWIRRLIAAVIDTIIVYIVAAIIAAIAAALAIPILGFGGALLFFGPFDLLRGVIFLLYAAFMESYLGATLGKQIMSLKVTTMDGKSATLERTFIRDISKIYSLLWLIDTLIGMATIGDAHQKYSDRFAGTTVASTIQRNLILPEAPGAPSP